MMIGLPRLIARLSETDPRRFNFEDQYKRLKAGYAGEVRVDEYLKGLNLPDSFSMIRNIESNSLHNFKLQIDTLIIAEKFILILEIKNIAGNLYFQTNPQQLIRKLDGEVTKMDCPIVQLENTHLNFQKWLQNQGFQIQLFSKVILANRHSYVKTRSEHNKVSFMKEIPMLLKTMELKSANYPTFNRWKLLKAIKAGQTPYQPFPLSSYFNIETSALKQNELCPDCHDPVKFRSERSRFCQRCNKILASNYHDALQDWFIVFKNSITNEECRKFLNIHCRHKAKYVLQSVGLEKIGQSTKTKYIWPKNKPFNFRK